jgi:hypothetical protein
VLESGDADAIKQLVWYIGAEDAFARMKDDPYINLGIYRDAWAAYFCSQGANCGPGSRDRIYQCLFVACDDAPAERFLAAKYAGKDLATFERYVALIGDIYARRQWDRFGIRAARSPWIKNGGPFFDSTFGKKKR